MASPKKMTFEPGHAPARWKYVHGCRCDGCTAENAAYQAAVNDTRAIQLANGAKVEHGKASTYSNWKCRCDACTKAHSEKMGREREDRARRLAADPSIVPHGRVATYNGWACRCDECKAAVATAKAARKAKVAVGV